jgi:uncharacterized protein (UPF0261 family)
VASMQRGLAAWVRMRRESNMPAGILSIGVPKLMVSTMASGAVRPYVHTSDIRMMYSVADFTGLNRLTRTILSNAAHAIAGMCGHAAARTQAPEKTLLAATMFRRHHAVRQPGEGTH